MKRFIPLLLSSFLIISCGQNTTQQKEIELKEKEIALKEKELKLKEEALSKKDTTKIVKLNSSNNEDSNNDLQKAIKGFTGSWTGRDIDQLEIVYKNDKFYVITHYYDPPLTIECSYKDGKLSVYNFIERLFPDEFTNEKKGYTTISIVSHKEIVAKRKSISYPCYRD